MSEHKLEGILSSFLNAARQAAMPGSANAPDSSFLRLHMNEAPFPLPETVTKAALGILDGLHRYPEEANSRIREAAAHTYGFTKEEVIAANGSSEILSLIYRSFLAPGDKAAMLSPGFVYNRRLASLQGANLDAVKWNDDYSLPENRLTGEDAKDWKFIVLANPNNPTGTFVPTANIERLAEKSERLIVVDEAYADFAPDNALGLVRKHPNLLVLRTLSKGYAAAGVRVGFGVGHPEIISRLSGIESMFNMNVLGQALGISILENRAAFKDYHRQILSQRDKVTDSLSQCGFAVIPSHTNFLFAHVPTGTNGAWWQAELIKNKILVSVFPEPDLKDYLRVTITTENQMETFVEAVRAISARAGIQAGLKKPGLQLG